MENTNNNFLWPLVGNDNIKEYLTKSIEAGKLAGAYIFSGPSDLGKATTARHFAKILHCDKNQAGRPKAPCGKCPSCRSLALEFHEEAAPELSRVHADYTVIEREEGKKHISIEQVRSLIRKLSMGSFMNSYKIGVIKDAESLNAEAANALLKTLEEPRKKVIVILTTSAPEAMPATIVSRCVVLRFSLVKTSILYDYLLEKYGVSRGSAKTLSRISLGRSALAVKFLEDKEYMDRHQQIAIAFYSCFYGNLIDSFQAIENLLSKKEGQERVREAENILYVWQAMARDALLLSIGLEDLASGVGVKREYEKFMARLSPAGLLRTFERLDQARSHLYANVNPVTVLQNAVAGS